MGPGLRRWTQMDDAVLEAVIQRVGQSQDIQWDEIASYLPGRSPSECLHHWEQKMSSSLNTGTWLPEEDDQLRAAVAKNGTKWTAVAAEVGTRNGEQCAKRWNDKLRPDLDHGAWTTEEDNLLLSTVEMHGRTWKTLAKKYFTNRAPLALKNRYTLLERRKKKRSESSAGSSVATASSSPNSQRDIDCADGQSSWSDAQAGDLYSTDLAGMNFTEINQNGDQEALHAAYWQGMVSQPSYSTADVSGITPDILDPNAQFTNPWPEPSPEHTPGSHSSSGYSAWGLPTDSDLPLTQLSVSIPRRKAGEIVGHLMDIAMTGDAAAAAVSGKVNVTLQLK